jgi:hypothetical protein
MAMAGLIVFMGTVWAETPLPSRVLLERLSELRFVKIGPHAVEKEELRIRAFPQEEVTEAPLAPGPDEQIDLGRHRIRMIHRGQLPQILATLIGRRRTKTAARLGDAVSGRIVDREAQVHA